MKGEILREMGLLFQEALEAFLKAIDLKPDYI